MLDEGRITTAHWLFFRSRGLLAKPGSTPRPPPAPPGRGPLPAAPRAAAASAAGRGAGLGRRVAAARGCPDTSLPPEPAAWRDKESEGAALPCRSLHPGDSPAGLRPPRIPGRGSHHPRARRQPRDPRRSGPPPAPHPRGQRRPLLPPCRRGDTEGPEPARG